jgi:tRNA threonylcarbamoyladenosine biosynthesis protein TsaB
MALILHIETATETCSVALANDQGLMDYRENNEGRSHAALLTVFIDDILQKNNLQVRQLDALAVSSGPGSYTGLRIGISAAKGLCFGASKPLISVSTLQSMAFGFMEKMIIEINKDINAWLCPMIDARRQEVYTSFFDSQGNVQGEVSAEIIEEHSFLHILSKRKVFFFGNGSDKCREIIRHPNAIFVSGFHPSAKNMIKLADKSFQGKDFKDVAYFEPLYLKDFVATTPKNKVLK